MPASASAVLQLAYHFGMRVCATILFLILFFATNALAGNKVTAALVSSTPTALPGSQFEVALRFAIQDGWHLYYTNPGDTGMPPKVTWELPSGVRAGVLKFPAPETIPLPENLTAYGYQHELTLLTTIDIDSQFDAERPVTLAGRLKWVVCSKDECVAEKQDVALEIAIGPVVSVTGGEFASWHAQQPQRPTVQELPAEVYVKPGAAEGLISVRMPADFGGESDFALIPPSTDFLKFDLPATRHAIVGGMMVTQPFKILPGDHPNLECVLMVTYTAADKVRKSVEVPLTFRFGRS